MGIDVDEVDCVEVRAHLPVQHRPGDLYVGGGSLLADRVSAWCRGMAKPTPQISGSGAHLARIRSGNLLRGPLAAGAQNSVVGASWPSMACHASGFMM